MQKHQALWSLQQVPPPSKMPPPTDECGLGGVLLSLLGPVSWYQSVGRVQCPRGLTESLSTVWWASLVT